MLIGKEGHIGYVGPFMKKTPQPASIGMPEASEPSNNNAMTAEIVVWVFAAVLAVTVIGGLLVSMLLTLIVIPAVYDLVDRKVILVDPDAPPEAAAQT